jgi:hypothetical protein
MNQIATSFHYIAAADPYKDWQRRKFDDFVPTGRQLVVIEAVRAALAEKLFYTSDVLAFCKTFLGVTAEQRITDRKFNRMRPSMARRSGNLTALKSRFLAAAAS